MAGEDHQVDVLGHDDVREQLEAVFYAGTLDAVGDETPGVELLDEGAAFVAGEGEQAGLSGDVVVDFSALCWIG